MQTIHYISAAIVALVLLLLVPFASTQCPSDAGDWLLYKESCYKLYNRSQFWYLAEMHCIGKKGHLVSIDNDFENRLVGRLSHCDDVWIGLFATDLSKRAESDGYSWTDEVALANYSRNNFTVPPTYHEPLIRANGLYWYNSLYHEAHPYMCEVRATSDNKEKCPLTMRYFQGHCYFMPDFEANFVEANFFCQNHSTHLVSVMNEAELRFLNSLDLDEEACQIENMWLGLIQLNPCSPDRGSHEHCYQWTDYSGKLKGYPSWAEGHPAPPAHPTDPEVSTDRSCVTLFGNQMLSTSCSERHKFICKAGTDTLQPGTPAWTTLDHPPKPLDEEELREEIATANGTFEGFNATEDATLMDESDMDSPPESSPTGSQESSPTASQESSPTASPESSPTASPESSPTASPESSPEASTEAPPTSAPEKTEEPATPEPVTTAEPTESTSEAEERGSDNTSYSDYSRR